MTARSAALRVALASSLCALSLGACLGDDDSNPAPDSDGGQQVCVVGEPGYQVATLDEIEAHMEAWDGVRVMLCEPLEIGPLLCTKMACSQVNPCCNQCGAGYRFDSWVGVSAGQAEGLWGCSGDDCSQTCAPFDGPSVGADRCYFGTFLKSVWGASGVLEVDGWQPGCS